MSSKYRLTSPGSIILASSGANIPSDLSNADYREYLRWREAGGVPDPCVVPPLPDPGTSAPRLIASALNVSVVDGDIARVDGIYGLAGAIYLDVGSYILLFLESQPDTNFFAVINGGAPCMAGGEKGADYLMIESKDAPGGAPVDPAQFSVQIFRI